MKYLLKKELTNRRYFLKNYIKKQCYKSILHNENLPRQIRWQSMLKQNKHIYSISRLKQRCLISNRGHSVLPLFKVSRIKLRQLLDMGLISGLKQASW